MSSTSCSKTRRSRSLSRLSQTKSPSRKSRSRSASPRKPTPKPKGQRGRPRIKPKAPEGQLPKKRGRPKYADRPKMINEASKLPNSELTRDQMAELLNPHHRKVLPTIKAKDESDESVKSDKTYEPPDKKMHTKKKMPIVSGIPSKTEPQNQFHFGSGYETARLIMLTPIDYTQASFTHQPILVLQIRGDELQKLINNSWHFIRNNQLFYNAMNHNVPEIKGLIQISSEFTDTSTIKDEFEKKVVEGEIEEAAMPDEIIDMTQNEFVDEGDFDVVNLLEMDEFS